MPTVGSVRPRLPAAPTRNTLASYGLTEKDWLDLCQSQRWLCPICQEPLGNRALAIDHEHVAGFKARKVRRRKGKTWKVRVMSPDERRKHVRGVLHSYCNRFVRKWLTLARAESILKYLQAYDRRKGKVNQV